MIYLDYAATTPIRKEVLDTYTALLQTQFANCDSLHDLGRESSRLMEQSRALTAELLHVDAQEIIFTSCASEANNLAIKGYAWQHTTRGKHIITTCVEHSSIYYACEQLRLHFGFTITYLPIHASGSISLDDLKKAISKDTILVSMMMVNNETGAINPIKECADYIHQNTRAIVHVDGVQALGKIPVDLSCVDMATFSAHKLYGLKGSAILYKRKAISLMPLINGGQQEQGIRAGTSNAPVNILFAKTLRLGLADMRTYENDVRALYQFLRMELEAMPAIEINSNASGSPYIMNFSCRYIASEIMLNALNEKGFAVAAQTTCSSKSKTASKVILAMGLGEKRAKHAIRVSIAHQTTQKELTCFIAALKEICHDYRTK